MRPGLIVIVILFISGMASFSQTISGSCYWVKLKDKTGTLFQISHPEAFLSKRALDRRIRQNIPIDQSDLPVSAVYLDTLKRRGLEVVHTSKWLNGVTVRAADTSVIRKITALPFVSSVQLTRPSVAKKSAIRKFSVEEMFTAINPVNYGVAVGQLTQLNGHYLHDRGFRGKGVQIAILDAGFWHVNQIAAFDTLRKSGRILGVRDFVDPGSDIYRQHTHGMSVLSCMGGNVPLTLIGTAPDASYYLLRSEEDATEYPIEEDNWVAAAELADSLGVDIINSSLGYYFFDDAAMNHTYSEMDGKTTRVTRGANMAFQKGIVVFNSAGNEGNNTWKRIIAPSDGENVIAVAAVDKNGIRASFSSVGPAFGGAIKPNVAATGSLTFLVTSAGVPGYSSGTSFSSPVLAGMGACLLQSNPYATAKQIKMAIEQSASLYNKPDSLLGYGIPDFEKAYNYLKLHTSVPLNAISAWGVSPNPFSNTISIRNRIPVSADKCFVNIYTMQGVCLLQSALTPSESMVLHDLSHLPNGVLILTIRYGGKEERFKIIKMPN